MPALVVGLNAGWCWCQPAGSATPAFWNAASVDDDLAVASTVKYLSSRSFCVVIVSKKTCACCRCAHERERHLAGGSSRSAGAGREQAPLCVIAPW